MKIRITLLFTALSLFSVLSASAALSLTDGLVSYWPMDAISGGSTPDVSFANNFNTVGTPTTTTGHTGAGSTAITFPTTADYLSISHGADQTLNGLPIYGGRRYTIALWVKGPATAGKAVFTEATTTATTPFIILQTGAGGAGTPASKLDIIIRNDGGGATPLNHVGSTNTVFDSTWHHIAWVDDNGACQMYVDGNPDKSFTYTNTGTYTFNNTVLGALVRTTVSMQYNTASFDDVAIWERPLTPAEVVQVKNGSLPNPVLARVPAFLKEPTSVTRQNGDWAAFSTLVLNNRPFTFQWYRNGSPIGTGTAATYQSTANYTNNNGDTFSIAVTNGTGFAVSSNAVLTVSADASPNITSGIISYWPLDEVTNTPPVTPEPYAGNFMVLSNMDATFLVPGQYGNALSFDGLTQFARRLNGAPIGGASAYSVSVWVKGDGNTQNDRRVFSEGNGTNTAPLFTIGTDSGGTSQAASILVRNDANSAVLNGKKSTRLPFDNNWHHLVWTDSSGQGRLYVDGVLDETDYTYIRSGTFTLDQTSLGAVYRNVPGNYYFGYVDEPASWNRQLSWTEVQQLFTNGVPHPAPVTPPAITSQPADKTNGVFNGDTVNFTVQATGTQPLSYRWRKNGSDINGLTNPSALTNQLTLANVQTTDNGTYSVVITNSGGALTSAVVQLTVVSYTPATNGLVLAADVDLAGFPLVQSGFSPFSLAVNGTNYDGVNVTVSPIGTSLTDRQRTSPVDVPPYFNQANLFDDFIFANSANDGTGMRILIERLATNTLYGLTVWSFDSGSLGQRMSDWTETSSGTPVTLQTGYTFDGSIPPTNDFEQTLGGLVTSSANGKLQIEGIRHGGTSFGVFVNGIRLVANPIPASRISKYALTNGLNVLAITSSYPNQQVWVQESPDLISWSNSATATPVLTNGMVTTFTAPVSNAQMFYRSASTNAVVH